MRYAKTIAALFVAGLTVLASALTDGYVSTGEGVQIAVAVTTAASVFLVPNVPQWPGMKTGIAVVLAVLNLATTLITDGLSAAEIVNLILAGLGVIAVYAVPNSPATTTAAPAL
jgi:hypothetical protein